MAFSEAYAPMQGNFPFVGGFDFYGYHDLGAAYLEVEEEATLQSTVQAEGASLLALVAMELDRAIGRTEDDGLEHDHSLIRPPPDITDAASGDQTSSPLAKPPGLELVIEEDASDALDDLGKAVADLSGGCEFEVRTVSGESGASLCRWHSSANSVGVISGGGHIFTKTNSNSSKVIMSNRGTPVQLSSICMVYDASLRCGGSHQYNYQILGGEQGAADGAGFVFDKQVRRNNIQRMKSVFLNQRGRICLRNNRDVCKLGAQLPPLEVGMWLTLKVDLDNLIVQFAVFGRQGFLQGHADVSIVSLLQASAVRDMPRSGFFCAVVTKDISVALA